LSSLTCLHCLSSWYDDSTGVILKCKTCGKCYHQDCHTPKVVWDAGKDPAEWECCVCTGEEKEFCCHCRDYWTVDCAPDNYDVEEEGPWTEAKNNRLMFCHGDCGRLWHQNCYKHRIIYPGDDKKWYCEQCELALDRIRLAEEQDDARHACRHRINKVTKKGHCKDVTRVDGVAAEGLRLADPAENHLTAATWVTKHTRGGGAGTGEKKSAGDASVFGVGDIVEARCRKGGRLLHGYYPGHITEANADGTFVVKFDDDSGDVDRKVQPKNMYHVDD